MSQYDFTSSKAFMDVFDIPPFQSGKLSNLTFAVKDVIDIAGYNTGYGNPTWAKTHPKAIVNAICVEQLLLEGAFCKGKTLTGELAFDLLGTNHFYGTPVNPKAPDRVPGGSSNGSASAVACGLVDFALGTDTGGSVRVPASYCGVYGYRPSHDRISVAGVNAFAPTFDAVGVLAKDAAILNKVAKVLLGSDEDKINSTNRNVFLLTDILEVCDEDIKNAFEKALPKFNNINGFNKITLSEITQQTINIDWLFDTYCILQWSEIWSSLGAWLEHEKADLGPATAKNMELARTVDRTKIQENIVARELFSKQLNQFLANNNILCMLTTPTLPPQPNAINSDRKVGNFYSRLLAMTAIAGLARLPQISVPLANVNGIPVGVSFIAAQGNDELLLDFCRQL